MSLRTTKKTSNNHVVAGLSKLLADSYALQLKTQFYHWNVEGEAFYSLHKLFEEQYNEIAAAVDEIAERIRALGYNTPGSFSSFQQLTSVKEQKSLPDSKGMLKDLAAAQEEVIKQTQRLAEIADKEGDDGTNDLAIGRLRAHQKALWMLESLQK